jgi:Spy/CpxP family protein refolding chaperone
MNTTRIAIAALLTAALSTAAFAGPPGRDGFGDGPRAGHKPPSPVGMLARTIDRHIDVTEAQREEIEAIMAAHRDEARPLARQAQQARRELATLIESGAWDEEAVTALAEQQGALTAQRIVLGARGASELLAVLTDEQRVELEAVREVRREMRRERSERRRERTGDD